MMELAIFKNIDAKLVDYTPGIDRAVRCLTIDDIDAMTEFYLRHRRADLSPALGAVAMMEMAATLVRELAAMMQSVGDMNSFRSLTAASASINAIPIPSDADLDRAALARPKVAALVAALRGIAAMKDYHSPRAQDRAADALAALEASHE